MGEKKIMNNEIMTWHIQIKSALMTIISSPNAWSYNKNDYNR
jgi:hypothetical protein